MKKVLIFIIAFAMLVGTLSISSMAAPVQRLSTEDELYSAATPEFYGRGALLALPDSAALVYAYDKISAGVEDMEAEISVYDGEHPLTKENFNVVLDAYRRDRADHFWLSNSSSISYTAETVTKFKPTYLIEKSELESKKAELDSAVNSIIAGIPSVMGELEREIMIHDALADRVTYEVGAPNAHNAYGALVEGRAVCEGYAEALQVLLFRAGIQSFLAIGSSYNPSTEASEGHEWNYVRIDGKYYHVDLTWDDQNEKVYHAYLNVSESRITEDHVIDPAGFLLPSCVSEENNYFTKLGGAISTYSVDTVAERLRENALSASYFLPSLAEKETFKYWVKDNITAIAAKTGINGTYQYAISSLGCEVIIFLDGYCLHTDAIYVEPSPPTCEAPGSISHYYCPDCTRRYLDSEFKLLASDRYLYVSPTGHVFTETLEDEAHLSKRGDCKTRHEYYYGCTACDAKSEADTFVGSEFGDHEYADGYQKGTSIGHYKLCEICAAQSPTEEHRPDIAEPTETEPQRCTECSYIIAPALNHTEHTPSGNYSSTDIEHWQTCVGCEERFNAEEHTYDGACDSECNICARTRDAAHDFTHNYSSDRTSHTGICACGERGELESHTDTDANGECDICKLHLLKSTPVSAEGLLSSLASLFSSATLDTDSLTLLTATLIVSVALIALVIILSRIFDRRK